MRVDVLRLATITVPVGNDTGDVLIVKLAPLAPAGITTPDGTVAEKPSCAKLTVVFTGARSVKVTVPVDGRPPTTDDGLSVNEPSNSEFTVKTGDVLVTPR